MSESLLLSDLFSPLCSCLNVERPALRSWPSPGFTGAEASCPCFGFALSPSDSDTGSGSAPGIVALFARVFQVGMPQLSTMNGFSPWTYIAEKHRQAVLRALVLIEHRHLPSSELFVPVFYNAQLPTQDHKKRFWIIAWLFFKRCNGKKFD